MNPDFTKDNGLVPAIVQHANSRQVLMLGYMNETALQQTMATGLVTFYSRSRQAIWTKGESSGNYLHVQSVNLDCDRDTLLIQALPDGPTCHTGTVSCFGEGAAKGFIYELEATIDRRITTDNPGSYTSQLFRKGINKVAQKVGEEAIELVIESKDNNRELFLGEAADLLYHLLILLRAKDLQLSDVEQVLQSRSR